MVMDFWEAQRRARRQTTIYVILFLLMTAIAATAAEFSVRAFAQENYNFPFPIVGMGFVGVTLIVTLYQYSMYQSQGGIYVAESMGAKRVVPYEATAKEQQLLNIVEEIALASGLPLPAVYIIPASAINAFAAGLTPDRSVIAVSQGALNSLNREELQAVVAHEFGHIRNGDMRLGLYLAAMVMGFYFLIYIAIRVFQFAPRTRDDDKKGGNALIAAAVAFLVAGALSWFFGSVLKAMVSRQREYLADASSVQFTRSPEGLLGALRKIQNETSTAMPASGMAFSHLYFDDRGFLSSLFATHPPLEKRIAALEGKNAAD